jgi:hypothetical protein
MIQQPIEPLYVKFHLDTVPINENTLKSTQKIRFFMQIALPLISYCFKLIVKDRIPWKRQSSRPLNPIFSKTTGPIFKI